MRSSSISQETITCGAAFLRSRSRWLLSDILHRKHSSAVVLQNICSWEMRQTLWQSYTMEYIFEHKCRLEACNYAKNVLHRVRFFNTFWNFSRSDLLKNHCGGMLPSNSNQRRWWKTCFSAILVWTHKMGSKNVNFSAFGNPVSTLIFQELVIWITTCS